jgi:hypothetical protein
MGKQDNDMWSHREMTHGPSTRRHMSKRKEDTWVDKRMTYGVMLALHMALC